MDVDVGTVREKTMNHPRSIARSNHPKSTSVQFETRQLGIELDQYIEMEQWSDALSTLHQLARLHPNATGVYLKMALVYQHTGKIPEAIAAYRNVLQRDASHLVAGNNLGNLLVQVQQYPEAVDCLTRASRHPEAGDSVLFNLAHACSRNGDTNRARECYEALLARNPDVPKFRWGALYSTPVVYQDMNEVAHVRTHWLQTIKQLVDRACSSKNAGPWMDNVLSSFYLHYACQADIDIQRAYGNALDAIASRVVPELRVPLRKRRTSGRRIRVGVVSANFHVHTVSKLFRGWFEHMDAQRFELTAIHVGTRVDEETTAMAKHFAHFHHQTGAWHHTAKCVRDMELDVVLFPEIGMDAEVIKLATTRMAPLQCMAWGHPVTSGLDNIDVFLSSEWMETVQGAGHVLERLVALPKLGIYYARPNTPPPSTIRAELGLRDNVVFFCSQSLQKLLPSEDDIWAQIAEALPDATICFIALPGSHSTAIFEQRLAEAFAKRGLEWSDHCVLLPRLTPTQFKRLSGAADVYLDSPSWSGGNTSLEAMAYGVPMVTKEGPLMRQRHTAAMLRGIGMDQWVATTDGEFVSKAISLGGDATVRASVRSYIQKNSDALFHQMDCVRALEAFFESEVGRTAPQRLDLLGIP